MVQSWSTHLDDQSPLAASPYKGPDPVFRDKLDALRSRWRTVPQEDHPSGYIESAGQSGRHDDKIGKTLWRAQRSYTRGVHKNERIDRSDYLWPAEHNLGSALEAQARGERFVPFGVGMEPAILTRGGKPGSRDYYPTPRRTDQVVMQPDIDRASVLRNLAPSWR
jgi:hypothetical protein